MHPPSLDCGPRSERHRAAAFAGTFFPHVHETFVEVHDAIDTSTAAWAVPRCAAGAIAETQTIG
jgi:hypothetical protein